MLKTERPLLKTIAYLRYSDNKQQGNHSLEIQKGQIRLYAERHNLEIISWCIDEATSAYSKKIMSRSGMQQVIEEVQNGADALIFYEESRLTRQISDFYSSVYLPIKCDFPDFAFFSTTHEGEWNPDNPLVQVKLVIAGEESFNKSKTAKSTQSTFLNSKSLRPGSRTPLGYDTIEGVLIPNKDLTVVLLIYFLSIWGHSNKTISSYLNSAQITTKKTVTWHSSTIAYILNNPAYTGNIHWRTEKEKFVTLTNTHKSIISSSVLYLYNQVADLKKTHGKMNTPFYFRNILKCKNCCTDLIAKDNSPKLKSKKYLTYKCNSCKKSLPLKNIHDVVFQELTNSISNQKETVLKNAYSQLKNWQLQLTELKAEYKKNLHSHHENLQRLIASSNPNKEVLINTFNESILCLSNKQKEINLLTTTINDMLHDSAFNKTIEMLLINHLETLSQTEKRILSLVFINQIQIDFQNDLNLTIDFRLTPFVSLENSLVEKPN